LVVEPTHLKNMLVKLDHLPNFRDENTKYLSCHHLDFVVESSPRKIHATKVGISTYAWTPKPMKNEGFSSLKYGLYMLYPLKMMEKTWVPMVYTFTH